LLLTCRATLFPLNSLAPARERPSAPEQALIRRRCAIAILSLIPELVSNVYFATKQEDMKIREVEELLGVFADSYCNRHLMYAIVELVLVRLIPELGEKGVGELMSSRLDWTIKASSL
jgi:hypothetical protein